MSNGWKYAAAGALGGAVIALVFVIGMGAAGVLPIHLTERARDEAVRGYLMAHPEVLADASNVLQARQDAEEIRTREAAVAKVGLKAFFDPKIAYITGPANAKTTLAEFFDYNCPYCRASVPALKKFYEAHKKDTRFAFIEFPIKGENSELAARAAIAARQQPEKYLTFHFLLMDERELVTPEIVFADAKKAGLDLGKLSSDMKDPSVDKAIKAAHALAEKTGINATPTFILNGRVRPGAIDDKMLAQMLES